MRVLHLGSELSWRGGEQQHFYLMEELRDKVESVVGCRAGSELERKSLGANFTCMQLGFRGLQISTARVIKNICETEKIDLIHCHTSRAHGAAFISAYMFGNNTPIIVSKRTDFPIKNTYLGKLKYNHSSIKKILCVSKKIEDIVKSSVENKEKVVTVYSGVNPARFEIEPDLEFRKRYGVKDDEFLIGNTSAIADHKDFYTFLDVAKKVTELDNKIKFIIIGKGPLEHEIKEYCTQLNLNDKVIFTGFLNTIPQILSQLDLFFMPSKEEGLGTSLLDAMCAQVPIVSTQAGGIPEIVIDGQTGYCAQVKNVDELTARILELRSSEGLRHKFVNNAYVMATQKFHKAITAEKTFEVYQQVLGK